MWRTVYVLYDHFKDIWPVMTLRYDYNMLFIERIYDTETFFISFSKSSNQLYTKLSSVKTLFDHLKSNL